VIHRDMTAPDPAAAAAAAAAKARAASEAQKETRKDSDFLQRQGGIY
jgi:penicillin-binding protein 1A